jgi:hypothetical protein
MMGEDGKGCIVEQTMPAAPDARTRVGGGMEDQAIAKALAARASTAALRKSWREERLLVQADATARKNLQARTLENASKKRSREKDTIARYFTSTRNFNPAATSAIAATAATAATSEEEHVPSEESLATAINVDAAIDGLVTLSASVDAISVVGPSWASASSSNVQVIGGTAPPVIISTDSSMPVLSEDDPNWHIFHDVPVTGSRGYESAQEEIDLPPIPKKTRRNYELTRKFQIEWSAKAPWSEMILTREGLLHMVKCTICSAMRGYPVIMGPKWDTVRRHGKRICHVKNTELYVQRRPTTVLQ